MARVVWRCPCRGPPQPPPDAVSTEVDWGITPQELQKYKDLAAHGDLTAMQFLEDYFYTTFGEYNEEGIYWNLQLARHGDCRNWEELMFNVAEIGITIPKGLLNKGENLEQIGEKNRCPNYVPRKMR